MKRCAKEKSLHCESPMGPEGHNEADWQKTINASLLIGSGIVGFAWVCFVSCFESSSRNGYYRRGLK